MPPSIYLQSLKTMKQEVADLPSGPLDVYRRKASFPWKDMLIFLDGEEAMALKVRRDSRYGLLLGLCNFLCCAAATSLHGIGEWSDFLQEAGWRPPSGENARTHLPQVPGGLYIYFAPIADVDSKVQFARETNRVKQLFRYDFLTNDEAMADPWKTVVLNDCLGMFDWSLAAKFFLSKGVSTRQNRLMIKLLWGMVCCLGMLTSGLLLIDQVVTYYIWYDDAGDNLPAVRENPHVVRLHYSP